MGFPLRLLLVEDSDDDAQLLLRQLWNAEYEIAHRRVETPEEFFAALAKDTWDLVIADYCLPQFSAPAALELLKQSGLDLPFIIVSGRVGEEIAAAAMRAGAHDYFTKSNLVRLPAAVARELGEAGERKRRRQAEDAQREIKAQLDAAQRIQERLLPSKAPEVPGFDIAGALFAAESAAGDYFDFLPMADHSLGLVIADVSGHGFHSALLMFSTYTLVHTLSAEHTTTPEVLGLVNRFLCNQIGEQLVTFLLVSLDCRARSLMYANAGHPAGYVLDAAGAVKSRLQSNATALGLLPDATFPECGPIGLAPGDLLLLVTDGIQEALSPTGELFGVERMLEAVRANQRRSAREILDSLHLAVRGFCGQAHLSDDLTAIVVKVENCG